MNKVINLPKRYSWEYMYKVNGCIFTLERCPYSAQWHLKGYASPDDLANLEPFMTETDDLKRRLVSFLRWGFNKDNF